MALSGQRAVGERSFSPAASCSRVSACVHTTAALLVLVFSENKTAVSVRLRRPPGLPLSLFPPLAQGQCGGTLWLQFTKSLKNLTGSDSSQECFQ